MLDLVVCYCTITVISVFNLLPLRIRLFLAERFFECYAFLIPSFNKVSRINLKVVYPHIQPHEIEKLLQENRKFLARFLVDSCRFHSFDQAWIEKHVECPFKEEYIALKNKHNGKGILTASGHLGSIEIQAIAASFVGRKFSFVARSFKNKRLDTWWNARREKYGNQVIPRSGAFSKVVTNINTGIDVAMLIDQNVQYKYALFVDWFNRPAATTFAFGRAAVETSCPVVISAITYLGDEKYRVNEHACDLSSIYNNESLTKEEKILEVTRRVSEEYQKMILSSPSEWFWMHRRWKSTPGDVPNTLYS